MKNILLLAVFAGLLSGCSSVTVKRDYDKEIDFTSLKTFTWQHAEQPQTGNPQIDNDLNDERIRNAVNATLSSKGLRLTTSADAEMLIAYFMDHQRKLNSSSASIGVGRGGYGRYGGVGYNTGVSEYDQANLTIDFIDPNNNKMIWRGVGSRAVYEGSNPEKSIQIINEAVAKILKKFPPKKRK